MKIMILLLGQLEFSFFTRLVVSQAVSCVLCSIKAVQHRSLNELGAQNEVNLNRKVQQNRGRNQNVHQLITQPLKMPKKVTDLSDSVDQQMV